MLGGLLKKFPSGYTPNSAQVKLLKNIDQAFDDGYKSDVEIVLPKLLKIGGEATFFIVKDYLNNDGFMCDKDVLQLSNQGMQIGSH